MPASNQQIKTPLQIQQLANAAIAAVQRGDLATGSALFRQIPEMAPYLAHRPEYMTYRTSLGENLELEQDYIKAVDLGIYPTAQIKAQQNMGKKWHSSKFDCYYA